jgi:reactive intermediate/imine deaminase
MSASTPAGPTSLPRFSSSRRAGDLLFVSGQLGATDGQLAPGGIIAETQQAISNLASALADAGATLSDIVHTTVYLASMSDWESMNGVYGEMLPSPYPARSTIGAELIAGARVEIDAIAYLPPVLA